MKVKPNKMLPEYLKSPDIFIYNPTAILGTNRISCRVIQVNIRNKLPLTSNVYYEGKLVGKVTIEDVNQIGFNKCCQFHPTTLT